MFFHEIVSGNCELHGLLNINDDLLCNEAAKTHGYSIKELNKNEDYNAQVINQSDLAHICFLKSRVNIPFHPPDFISAYNQKLALTVSEGCDDNASKAGCECTVTNPCFCASRYYVDRKNDNFYRKTKKTDGQFSVTWTLSLGGRESLLEESAFLKAAFEQSVKDYINNDILCTDDLAFKGAEFFGVEIVTDESANKMKKKAVSGNGSCKGDLSKCKKPLKAKKKVKEVGTSAKVYSDDEDDDNDGFCEVFLKSTIFQAFEKRLLTASQFNYNVDVNVLNDLEGKIDLTYDVSFEPEKGDGLDQIEDVDMDAQEPVVINPVCSGSQCTIQREIIKNISEHFELDFDDEKHECMILGINCNEEDLITHIWMSEFIFVRFFLYFLRLHCLNF